MLYKKGAVCPECDGEGTDEVCNQTGFVDFDDGSEDNFYVEENDLPVKIKEKRDRIKQKFDETRAKPRPPEPPERVKYKPKEKTNAKRKK